MKDFSIIALEQIKYRLHIDNVTNIIKSIMPLGVYLGVGDVYYQTIIDSDINTYDSYPTPDDTILFWSGKTNLINASWHTTDLSLKYDYIDEFNVRKAWDKNTLVVIAVGNMYEATVWSQNWDTNEVPTSATSPFDITAGALKNGIIAKYSFSNPRFVDYFLDGDFNGVEGTSYAAPRLTGHISKIMDWYPEYGYSQIRTMLEKNSISMVGKNNQVIDAITDVKKELDAKLDTKVLVEDLIEIFQGRNPTDQEVNDIVNTIRFKPVTGNESFVDETVAKAFRIYKAAFDRIPDAIGLDHWTTQMDQGMSLDKVAQAFIDSQEFKKLYGNLSNNDFITKLYNNVLDRAPDASGFIHWQNEIRNKTWSHVLTSFSESQENKKNVAPLIDNKSSIKAWANADEIVTNIAIVADSDRKDVPLVDQISALYHVFKDRDPTEAQLEKWVDVYEDLNEDWGDMCNLWVQTEKVKLLGTYDFEVNNYQAIQI